MEPTILTVLPETGSKTIVSGINPKKNGPLVVVEKVIFNLKVHKEGAKHTKLKQCLSVLCYIGVKSHPCSLATALK
jgi:hypothetical protein